MDRPIIVEEYKFIGHLEKLVKEKDRGGLAALRRGLGKPPGIAREMDSHVLRFLPPEAKEKQENAFYVTGALFAYWHQGKEELVEKPPYNLEPSHYNFGASLWAMVKKDADEDTTNRKYEDKWKDAIKRVEKRLVALLNCHQDDLRDHLRHTVSLLKSKDIPINWAQLLHDIQCWHWESRSVQRDWARQFWRESQKEEKETAISERSKNEEVEEE